MKVTVLQIVVSALLIASTKCLQQDSIPNKISPEDVNFLVEPIPEAKHDSPPPFSFVNTVKEVENMIISNPKLPRLTRGEIIDLLENITKADNTFTILQQASLIPENHRAPKAVMKVLPITPDAANTNNVEELYTKRPVTQIVDYNHIGQGSDDSVFMDFDVPKVQFDPVPANEEYKPITVEENFNGNPFNVPNPTYKRKTTTSTTTTSTTAATTSDPTRHYFVERKPQGLRRKTTTTTATTVSPSVSTHRQRSRKPMRHRTTTATTQRHPNHRYEDEHANEVPTSSSSTMFPSNGINIVQPPSLPPKIINEDLLGAHDEKKEVYIEKDVPVSFIPVKDIDLSVGDDKEQDDNVPLIVDFPEDLKGVLTDLNMESALKQKTKKHNKSKTKPTQKPTQKPTGEIGDEQLNNLLATLKLLAAQQTSTTTTTTVIPDVSDVVDNLSPDMKDLLMNFGLIPNPNPPKPEPESLSQAYESYNPEKAEVKPDSYTGFKPLPEDNNSRNEMHELLARFGLGRNARKQKSLNKNKEKDIEMVPEEYQKILEDIGFGEKDEYVQAESQQQSTKSKHVFNPSENLSATKDEIEKLNKLSNVIKQLEHLNRTITDEDLQKIDTDTLKVLVQSLNNSLADFEGHPLSLDEQDAPDPLKLEEELMKNEVKREETTTSTTEAPSSTEDTTASDVTDGTETPNMKDLEDSFGGPGDKSTEASEVETQTELPPPPPKKPNGFYFLFDWNSFFDMDDQKGRRVNLRFQPKVGDPRLWYSVP
ncbi:uncharacterized protein LOC126885677 [Diabrotica virgifera virgifera]|uniref:Uncharacterized protein n=1 Tax=Diabrotica virgifera virgifera TaxID=50390 RepID=A0ABM5KDR6_DIAVI|nr:uncharacterized protein LOC126885677 [Diabrotica virgifera virgifera]